MPYALSIGMTKQEFMRSKPIELVSYGIAHKYNQKRKDEELWLQGYYNFQALQVALAHFGAAMAGSKSDAKYPDTPLLQHKSKYDGLTQEEIDNLEIQQMILAEEAWIKNDEMRGLAKTIIQ